MYTKKGPWSVIETKTVYKNQWLHVTEDAVVRPDGKNGTYSVVHLKHGVAILPIDTENNVYLTKEYHYAVERETIEVVSGGIDADETTEDAALRELNEELGITADEVTELGKIHPLTSAVEITNHLFIARKLQFSQAVPEGTEIITRIKVPFKEAIAMVFDGRILDATSIALILKAKEFLSY